MLISRCSTPTSEASAATPTHRLRKSACRSRPFRTGEATNRTDARLAWTSHGLVPVTVAVYSNHLFDYRYVTGVQTISATTLGTPFTNITAPRFYGVEVGARF